MSTQHETARKAVLAMINPHMELCEDCANYAEKLIQIEMTTRTDPVRNQLGLPYPE